ncbi:MAG TPA: hypothetical protein DCG08_00200 [Dialister sp.]|nr:hypothetical protein [Dialister sp.]
MTGKNSQSGKGRRLFRFTKASFFPGLAMHPLPPFPILQGGIEMREAKSPRLMSDLPAFQSLLKRRIL